MIANFMALSSEAVAESSAFGRFVEKIDSWIQIGPVEFLVNVAIGLLIVLIGKLVIVGISRILKRALDRSKKINELMARFILKLVNVIGWIFLIIAFLGRLGLDMGPVLAGLASLVLSLGLHSRIRLGTCSVV